MPLSPHLCRAKAENIVYDDMAFFFSSIWNHNNHLNDDELAWNHSTGMSEGALNVESYFQSHREQMSETIILILIVFIFQILCLCLTRKITSFVFCHP